MARRKWSWTSLQEGRASQVIEVTNNLEKYWPLTLRQIYYQLVAGGLIENTRSKYTLLSLLVKWMRIDERLPWDVLEDRTRTITDKRGWENMSEFIESETEWLFNGYARCLVQGQNKYIEVWTEKDALLRIFHNVVEPYCMRAVTCRGYQSVTFIADFYTRAEQAIMRGQTPVILYFGDLDPSGVQMLEATIETLESELGLEGVIFKRIALLPEHIQKYNVPHDPTAIKKTDTRYKKYKDVYGDTAVELDAHHPGIIREICENAIRAEIDIEMFESEKEEEEIDLDVLREFRERALQAVDNIKADMFGG